MGPFVSQIAPSIRLILAMFQLYADIETGFGKAIIDLLKKQFPGQTIDVQPSSIGHKMMAIARRELQQNDQDAMDSIQDFLTYLTSSGFDFTKESQKGKPGAKTWKEALDRIYSNLRLKAMSGSFKKFNKGEASDEEELAHLKFKKEESKKGLGSRFQWKPADEKELKALEKKLRDSGKDPDSVEAKQLKRKNVKRDKSIDEAFGKRPEGGGASEGGEARMPTGEETALGKALDDKAALKEFYDLIDSYVPDLKASLSKDSAALFDLIFEHNVGSFGAGIDENMGQSSALRENYPEVWDDFMAKWGDEIKKKNPGLDEKKLQGKINLKWSAYLGTLREKLLEEIWSFIDEHMTPGDYEALKDQFFSDTTPQAVRGLEKEKSQQKQGEQRGKDLRKILRAQKQGEENTPSIQNLIKKVEKELKAEKKNLQEELDAEWKKSGKKIEEELAKESKKGGKKTDESSKEEGQSQTSSVMAISARVVRPWI